MYKFKIGDTICVKSKDEYDRLMEMLEAQGFE